MKKGGLWRELFYLLAATVLLGFLAWGLVHLGAPTRSVQPKAPTRSTDDSLRHLVRTHLEAILSAKVIKAPIAQHALETIWHRLQGKIEPPLVPAPEFIIVGGAKINALTFPGRLVVFYSGLLEKAKNADEVAAVMAHELGHVYYHDPSKQMEKRLLVGALSLAVGTVDNRVLVQVFQDLTTQAMSRRVEDRADTFGLKLLARCHIAPQHFADFLARLDQGPAEKFVEHNLPYLGDHATQVKRIQKAEAAQRVFLGPERLLKIDWKAVQEELLKS